MDLFESFLRITWDPEGEPITLLDFGEPLWSEISLNGSQMVQPSTSLRARGIRTFPRGNEQNELSFEKASVEDSFENAFAKRINGVIDLPRSSAPVLIELKDERAWIIHSCSITSWPGGQIERLTREGIVILGGHMERFNFIPDDAMLWGDEDPVLWDDGDFVLWS